MLELTNINPKYIDYLRNEKGFSTILTHKEHTSGNGGRKYVGVLLKVDKFNYFCGITSKTPNNRYYTDKNGIRKYKKSKYDIEQIETDKLGNETVKGRLILNVMIPVPNNDLKKYDINLEPDINIKNGFNTLVRWLRSNEKRILNRAAILMQSNDSNCLDYKTVENCAKEWTYQKLIRNEVDNLKGYTFYNNNIYSEIVLHNDKRNFLVIKEENQFDYKLFKVEGDNLEIKYNIPEDMYKNCNEDYNNLLNLISLKNKNINNTNKM